MNPLVLLEMVDFLADRIAVALAEVGNDNSSGGIRIVGISRCYVVISINTELGCPVVGKGTMIEDCIIDCNVKVKITVRIHKETVVIREQKIA